MNRNELLASVKTDLGSNFHTGDDALLGALLDEITNDALMVSNRYSKAHSSAEEMERAVSILESDIRKAVKSIYLKRGAEEVSSQSVSGISASFDNAIDIMAKDIIRTGKRILK